MPKRGKRYEALAELYDKNTQYEIDEAVAIVKKAATAKFDETVELHIKLGVDSRHADQQVLSLIHI